MGKGKPRHNPDKYANRSGGDWTCNYYDGHTCHGGCWRDLEKCKGNPHNCVKTFYARLASRSDIQKQNGDYKRI